MKDQFQRNIDIVNSFKEDDLEHFIIKS